MRTLQSFPPFPVFDYAVEKSALVVFADSRSGAFPPMAPLSEHVFVVAILSQKQVFLERVRRATPALKNQSVV
jgi:hypothetical protein